VRRADELQQLIEEASVPGMAAAFVDAGRLREIACCGYRGADAPEAIDENTVFAAASLTKPVFAHAVLQLVDRGRLALDTPLGEYLPNYLPRDPRASTITARHALSHSGGFPNWRSADFPLRTYFQPGAQFSYSGEGYFYLQQAIERVAGQKIHVLVDELVFRPFGMTRSGLIWDFRFDGNHAYPHDAFGRPALGYKPGEANAAWSLQTTAGDFARFLTAVLAGARLTAASAAAWLRPQIDVRHAGAQCLRPNEAPVDTGVAWGLGWGLEPELGSFFQWGDNGTFHAFATGSTVEGRAVAIFTNGASGLSVMPKLVAAFMSGPRPSLAWLNYVDHDAPVRRMLRGARAQGIKTVWPQIATAGLERDELYWIAKGLDAAGCEDDAAWLREQLNNQGDDK